MAKKFVRGITDVKTINNQDFDTNNVNDLLSDGQYNYIHRKKGKSEEYHNLTDNIKTISSDNTELLSVTNNNKTTNTATLHPKHDAQKEQVLESERNTVTIKHGTNGTPEKTTVDTNPQKVLEHEKLKTGDGLTTSFNTDETTIMFKATKKPRETNLNTLGEGVIYGKGFSIDQVPGGDQDTSAGYVTINISENKKVQFYIREQTNDYGVIRLYYRFIINGEVTEWRKMPGDRSDLNYELAQKEQVLESQNNTITINHGTNGTDEKTTVDTNPQKVLEHENLVSASEYVTIEHNAQSEISQIKTEKLKNVINELSDKIHDTVGTVNLFKGSRDFSGSWIQNTGVYAEDYQGVKIFKTQDMWNGRSQEFEVKAGEEYVFSAYVKSSAETDRVAFYLPHSSKQPAASGVVSFGSVSNPISLDIDLTDEYKRIAIKIKITRDGWIAPRVERSNTNAYLFFGGYKLERYNVPTDYSPNPEDVYPLLAQKQNKLTAMDGISITGDSIYLTSLNDYSEDLNNLTYTCTAKPIDNTPNLPTGVGGNGVLSVIRVGNVVSQTYHALDNNVYYRITNNSSTTFVWTPWVKVNTTALS